MFTVKDVCIISSLVLISMVIGNYYVVIKGRHPNAGLNTAQLIEKFGYPLEIHELVTEDGYIVTLHRIPKAGAIPVLLMHGFLHSATEFINLGKGHALGLLLADAGYDVWLGNARGTTWSRKHSKLNPDSHTTYWNFSMHELGKYDIKAFVDHIIDTSKQNKIHYLGYSQGVALFFILLSERPQYAEKFRLMTALAPAVYLNNSLSPLIKFSTHYREFIKNTLSLVDINELFEDNGMISWYLKQICDENSFFMTICLHHVFLLHGYSEDQMDTSLLSLIFSNLPAGGSIRQMLHLVQLFATGIFEQYDYGSPENNVGIYGSPHPPHYDLSRATIPVALYYSQNDWLINLENIDHLAADLPRIVKKYMVPLDQFNHNDFVHAKDVKSLLYDEVIEEMGKH